MGRPGGPGPLDPIFDVPFTTGLFAFNNTPGIRLVGVTINKGASQDDPTNATPIIFDVVFSEAVTGFVTGDVDIIGSAGATTAIVTDNGDSIHFTVTVSGMTQAGGVTATVPAGVATGISSGYQNAHSTSTDNTVAFQAPPPVSIAVVGTPLAAFTINYYGGYLPSQEWLLVSDVYAFTASTFVVSVATNSPSVLGQQFIGAHALDSVWLDSIGDWYATGRTDSGFPNVHQAYTVDNNPVGTPSVVGAVNTAAVSNSPIYFLHHGDILCCSTASGMQTINVSNPASPSVVLGTFTTAAGRMAGRPGDTDVIYIANGGGTIYAVDISNPASPSMLDSIAVPGTSPAAQNIAAIGDYLYYTGNGLFGMVDATDPTNLQLFDDVAVSVMSASGITGVTVEPNGLYAYVCGESGSGVAAIDCSDPNNLSIITSNTDSNVAGARDIHVDGDRLFVTTITKVTCMAITR